MKRKSIAAIALAATLAVSIMGNPMLSTVRAEESGEEQVVLQAEEISNEEAVQEESGTESEVQPTEETAIKNDEQPTEETDTEDDVQPTEETDIKNEVQPTEETGTENEVQPTEDVAQAEEAKTMLNPEEVVAAEDVVLSEGGVAIDAVNFPDENFRAYIASAFDKDADGKLSDEEIAAVTTMNATSKNIQDLTGVKLFVNLRKLNCYSNNITTIDVSGMQNLYDIEYQNNKGLKTLDFRNCPSLVVAYHSIQQETVYISAGMTNYGGCDAVRQHTGNIVIDLDGYYTVNADGSKSVDFDSVISSRLISVFNDSNGNNPNYNLETHVLTIPAGDAKTEITAGYDGSGNPTKWTFYTDIQNVDDCVVSFQTNGGSIVEAQTIALGGTVTEPEAPTKEGFVFQGWYVDQEYTQAYDFATPVNTDITLYAKWVDGEVPAAYVVSFDSKGGSAVDAQTVSEGAAAVEPTAPTRAGFLFKGWFLDEAYTQAYDFKTPVNANITLFANWEEIRCILVYDVNGGKWKTGGTQTQVIVNSFGKVTLNIEEPTRTGYKFRGWTLEKANASKVVKEVTFDQNQQTITVYALWEKIPQKATIVNTVKTGDQTSIGIWAAVVVLSAGLAVVLFVRRRRGNADR